MASAIVAAYIERVCPGAEVARSSGTRALPAGAVEVDHPAAGRRVLIFFNRPAVEDVRAAVADSGCSLVTWDSPAEELADAVSALLGVAPPVVSRAILKELAALPPPEVVPPSTSLSRREHEVLDLLADGLSNSEIAARLCLSESTVRTHLHSISLKLGAAGRMRMVRKARDQHLVG